MAFTIIKNGDLVDAPTAMANWRWINYGSALLPVDSAGAGVNNTINFGSASYKFKDGYLYNVYSTNGEFTGTMKVTGASTLTGNVAMGGNLTVVGTIAATGTITGTLATAAQPNITSLGTLSGNLKITGGLVAGTSDGSDNSSTFIQGGGANATTRGGAVMAYGNDGAVSYMGHVYIQPGIGNNSNLFGQTIINNPNSSPIVYFGIGTSLTDVSSRYYGPVGVGRAPSYLLDIYAEDGTYDNVQMAKITNMEATAGRNYGLSINAGSNSSDAALTITNRSSADLMKVKGDGTVEIPGYVSCGGVQITGGYLQMTTDIGSSVTRAGKGWLTNLDVSNKITGSISGSCDGLAASATKLATARAINGVDFDGTAPITVTAAAGTLTGTALPTAVVTSSLTSVGTLTNLTVTNTIAGSVNGLAASATKLATARAINGVNFDGTAPITVTAAAGTLTGTALPTAVVTSSLTSVGTLTNLTVTNTIAGSVNGLAASATKLATARAINGVNFDGTAPITVTADANTLSGTTLKSTVVTSSLTSVGTLTGLTVTNPITGSITGLAGSVAASTITGTTLPTAVVTSSLTSVGTLTNLTVTNTIAGSINGLAASATKLATARAINGVNFDGTGAITVTAAASTLTGTALPSGVVTSSLTSLGTLAALAVGGNQTVTGTITATGNIIGPILENGAGALGLRIKIVQIGDWNMDTTAGVLIPVFTGSNRLTDVIAHFAFVYEDGFPTGSWGSFNLLRGGYTRLNWYLGNTIIELQRTAGGHFDSGFFQATSFNRGFIVVLYKGAV